MQAAALANIAAGSLEPSAPHASAFLHYRIFERKTGVHFS
jgi:hypothetical protein